MLLPRFVGARRSGWPGFSRSWLQLRVGTWRLHSLGVVAPSARLLVFAALAAALPGCGHKADKTGTGPGGGAGGTCTTNPLYPANHCPDAGGPDNADAGHGVISTLTLQGVVKADPTSPGIAVSVTARCGDRSSDTLTDDNGHYQLDADAEGCDSLVIEFDKEQFLPILRVVPVPPPTTPVTLDVTLARLSELQCGTENCVVDGDFVTQFPTQKFQRGWVATMSGAQALDYYGGEFRDTEGNVVEMTGFGYFDFRDDEGARITKLSNGGFAECFQVDRTTYTWLVDIDPSTKNTIEMNSYRLDENTGTWKKSAVPALVAYTSKTVAINGRSVAVTSPATAAQLPDIQTAQLNQPDARPPFWVCTQIDGSGWYAWGIGTAEKTCFTLTAKDQCNDPVANAVFVAKGERFGYLARAWTGWDGNACIAAARSEPTGSDFDFDDKQGETTLLDFTATYKGFAQTRNAREVERQPGSCDDPQTCTPLELDFVDYTKKCK